jgi:membrane protein YqaA with SNARE-associated domain
MKSSPHLPAFAGERLDALDARLAEPWLEVPADFEQRLLAAMDAAPAAERPRRVDAWARWVLLAAGLAGLGECLSFLAGLWLATAAAL